MIKYIIIIFLCLNSIAFAEEFKGHSLGHIVTDIPETLKITWQDSFNTKPETLKTWAAIIASSVFFYIYDEKIYTHAKKWGRSLGLGNDDHTKSYITLFDTNILQGPSDVGSTIYYLGNGWTQFFVASSFYINGSMNHDIKAQKTGTQILTALLSGSLPTQLIKRATGREDPNRTTVYRGKWKPFSKDYDKDISAHDAVPSGHLMAITSTMTVIDTNYPEYRHIIRPIAYTALALVSFQMVNIGVHWVSDYPLGIAIGYVAGRAATKVGSEKSNEVSSWNLQPLYYGSGKDDRTYGLITSRSF
ncbi:MAG: hypothetical protein COW00_00190 [Bdellovibrio sp. CG12_big_fil_rev_8_21_14_0_65_39_13]|nr:MAG: hypothetical protein COW78_19905 [Bdellovibrio sp. CG22_combo_CG10-13_8_21_14_all_39_27]PIQ62902.1 MAG: hypothetical protein COW00_00190 [Bdellovibrio sp. CG12_big_fil_rev_8_21_14_0_65_39_13]PIR33257.1 MAG: hypothetical protein COV37_16925 [Bdellovibrio sp. CG11_big_fil_rev_8_21_14_0_20_39_38]PJB52605.1 MAG: hypothetical protein CO099_11760 [Bdellovibrio sp. CG_4_9_14_3_um_filter_39_7]